MRCIACKADASVRARARARNNSKGRSRCCAAQHRTKPDAAELRPAHEGSRRAVLRLLGWTAGGWVAAVAEVHAAPEVGVLAAPEVGVCADCVGLTGDSLNTCTLGAHSAPVLFMPFVWCCVHRCLSMKVVQFRGRNIVAYRLEAVYAVHISV